MTRINALRKIAAPRDSVAWGKDSNTSNIANAVLGNANALIFAALLIICSVAVGCSSGKPKPVNSSSQTPMTQAQPLPQPVVPAPVMQAESKPTPKKPVVHKRPATVNYTDKTYGVTFEYPRRYAIETGNAATDLLLSSPLPMNFVQPGGVALAAVELPETSFANTDFSSAFFNVSVNKTLSADQCAEFAVPQPKSVVKSEPATPSPSNEVAKQDTPKPESQPVAAQSATTVETAKDAKPSTDQNSYSKLLLGDLELSATEAVSGEGPRQSDSKYFHVFQNGACYEFGLNVTTVASEQGVTKHVDRDKVFNRLEQILSTVKISPVTMNEVTAEAPAPVAPETPAQ